MRPAFIISALFLFLLALPMPEADARGSGARSHSVRLGSVHHGRHASRQCCKYVKRGKRYRSR